MEIAKLYMSGFITASSLISIADVWSVVVRSPPLALRADPRNMTKRCIEEVGVEVVDAVDVVGVMEDLDREVLAAAASPKLVSFEC